MARTLLTWRWAVVSLLLVAAVVAMVLLGRWQWERSVPVASAPAVPLAEVDTAALPDVTAVAREAGDGALVPADASGDLVAVRGTWRTERTLLVADRPLDNVSGRWVVTPVELDDGTGLVPVVRGWVPAEPGDPANLSALPTLPPGPVEVAAWVEQSEPLDIPVDIVQPDGVITLLSTADLANRWPEDLVPGFVVAAPTPAQVAAADGLTLLPEPPTELTESRDWRNLAYAAQWFVFAAFAVLLWWRMLRDDTVRRQTADQLERSTT